MKKCPVCGNSYQDYMKICPECNLYLIEDVVSDFQQTSSSRRSRVHAVQSQYNSQYSEDMPSDRLTPGKNVGEYDHESRGSRIREPKIASPNHFGRILLAVMRFLIPLLLIIGSVVAIVIFWDVIRQFLSCCLLGAIIGGISLTYLSVRFGGTFNTGAMVSGAVAGMILACTLQYNILDVGTELSVLIEAFAPVIIMILGIWLMIRSII